LPTARQAALILAMATISEAMAIALQHHQEGRLQEAEQIYRQVLQVEPRHAGANHLLGAVAHQAGRHDLAVEYIERAIALKGDVADFHHNLATAYYALRRIPEAINSARRALVLDPDFAEAHNNLGNCCKEQKRLDEAVEHYRRAAQLQPGLAVLHRNLGDAHKEQGMLDEAVACYERALAFEPTYADAFNNLGVARFEQKRLGEAVESYLRALELKPDLAEAHNNLGDARKAEGRLEEAIDSYRRAVALKPELAEAQINLGVALRELGTLEEAIAWTRRALDLNPDSARAHYNLGMFLLQLGQHEEGWRESEHRFGCANVQRAPLAPRWTGGRAEGRTILIHSEQGIGDGLQFLRYAALVRERSGAKRVILETKRELVRLLTQTCGGDLEILPELAATSTPPPCDFEIPLMSVPLALGLYEPRPMSGAYLWAEAESRRIWGERLGATRSKRVGLVWAGNPDNKMDRSRSMRPEELLPLFDLRGAEYYSLQLGVVGQPANPLENAGLIDLTAHLTDFAETAALVAELDLVISVDTAVAHLAGAMGRTVWVLLPSHGEWRWGIEGETTPWYPTMRLFRQSALGDWKPVVRRIAAELERFINSQGSGRA
jgi:tetratricopeptide (TPR) repeat protein